MSKNIKTFIFVLIMLFLFAAGMGLVLSILSGYLGTAIMIVVISIIGLSLFSVVTDSRYGA